MKRRDFLTASIGVAMGMRHVAASAQQAPCPPPTLAVEGGNQTQSQCEPPGNAAVPPNTVALFGVNDEDAVRPGAFSADQWQYSLFASWSGGTFVPGWGTHGAYACCGTGGHGAPENYDAVLFDFADYTWKYIPNTNGVAADPTPLSPGQTSGSPWYEKTGTNVPAPAHCYKHVVAVGNTIYKALSEFVVTSASTLARSHKYVLSANRTGTWSRAASNSTYTAFSGFGSFGGTDRATAIHDALRNRIWLLPTMSHWVSSIPWLDLGTGIWSGSPVASLTADFSGHALHIYDAPNDRVFLGGANGQLYQLSLANPTLGGWTPVSSSNLTSIGLSGPEETTRWHLYPSADGGDNCYYTYIDNGSRQLKKFNPATRAFSTVTIGNGAAIPRINPGSGQIYPNQATHFTRFFYVPARRCFAFVPGNGQQVALMRP